MLITCKGYLKAVSKYLMAVKTSRLMFGNEEIKLKKRSSILVQNLKKRSKMDKNNLHIYLKCTTSNSYGEVCYAPTPY